MSNPSTAPEEAQTIPTGGSGAPGFLRRAGRVIGICLLALVVLIATAWGALAIYYSNLPGETLRTIAAAAFSLGTAAAFIFLKRRWRTLAIFACVFGMLIVWYFLIPASNDRDWQPDVAVLATADINGNQVTIHNVRNLDYKTETDFTPRYYDKTLNLDDLNSVDFINVYWGSPAIAHVMVSFGFAGKDYVCMSIETRKEKGEGYSTIKGFFRQFEVYNVVADERDLIRVRTNYRNPMEDVYVYRTRMPIENQRKLFLDYLREVNELARKPEWYNTVTDNCTTGVLRHIQSYGGRAKYNWKILLSGYSGEYAYELKAFDTGLPFEELRRLGHVNERAHAAGDAENFSQKIREGMPMPTPLSMEAFRKHD